MRSYLDASALLPLFIDDDWTDRAKAWAATEPDVVMSHWTVTEFSSALSHLVRRGRLDPEERDQAENALNWWMTGRVGIVDLDPEDVTDARFLLHRHWKLRAPDALHLAVATRLRARMVTYDLDLAEAAREEGLEVVVP